MTTTEAKRIGGRQGLIAVGLGVLIAQFIMTLITASDNGFISAFFWFTRIDYWLNTLIGIIILLVCGYFSGQLAGDLILVKKWNHVLTGFLTGLTVLVTTTFFASWTGFIQEGSDTIGTNDNPFFDYIVKPMYWVILIGFIPAFLVGIWFGRQLKKEGTINTNTVSKY